MKQSNNTIKFFLGHETPLVEFEHHKQSLTGPAYTIQKTQYRVQEVTLLRPSTGINKVEVDCQVCRALHAIQPAGKEPYHGVRVIVRSPLVVIGNWLLMIAIPTGITLVIERLMDIPTGGCIGLAMLFLFMPVGVFFFNRGLLLTASLAEADWAGQYKLHKIFKYENKP